ncbi:UxaA family hydrolase [Bacillus haikouensis]|jgi:(2R)-sulfolactate sulfo-lyase subunit alpha|uniref:UxaA family hydrolase n=1 Tax=Bacillus haikouensis TaxID=1510468 RepID=UPI0015518F58|nr:UxaA family hydrolase [Bacillus haikouensis]NQD67406.1 UxaA family hydrolase [Bacillus haikouensis]
MSQNGQAGVVTEKGAQEAKAVSTHKFLIHHKGDHVGVATTPIEAGEKVIGINMDDNSEVKVISKGDVPLGHKISLVSLEKDKPVLKYGVQIGITTEKWEVGEYVHTHNIKTARW